MTKSLISYIILVLTIVIYLFIFLFNIYILFFLFFLGGLPLYGVYDSFVDYPYDNVIYCH